MGAQRHPLPVQAVVAKARHLEVDPNKDVEAVALTVHSGHLRPVSNSKIRLGVAIADSCMTGRSCAHN